MRNRLQRGQDLFGFIPSAHLRKEGRFAVIRKKSRRPVRPSCGHWFEPVLAMETTEYRFADHLLAVGNSMPRRHRRQVEAVRNAWSEARVACPVNQPDRTP
jgi:hypothetical protein